MSLSRFLRKRRLKGWCAISTARSGRKIMLLVRYAFLSVKGPDLFIALHGSA
ncbi:hypothetical protein ABMA08_01555 [Pseudomonas yamanorum]